MLLFRSFVTFCYLRLTFQASQNGECREERSQRGFALLNSTYGSKTVESYPGCVNLCFHDPRCLSLNFWWYTRKCDLNKKAREHSRRDRFVAEPSSIYMGMAKLPINQGKSNKNSCQGNRYQSISKSIKKREKFRLFLTVTYWRSF